jgi:hypothetical protein
VDAELEAVVRLERELQTSTCRRHAGRVRALLADDFVEVGASGRVWDLSSTLEQLDSEAEDEPEIEVHALTARSISGGIVMVRWDSDEAGRRARRTSLRRRDPDGWRLVHHQGTLLSPTSTTG